MTEITQRELFEKYHHMIEGSGLTADDEEYWRLIDEYGQKAEELRKSARKRIKLEEERKLEW